jgi:hypothetical protein
VTTTQLELLINQAVERSVVSTIARHTDRVAEGIVDELLKEPATRAKFSTLINAAIGQALANLNAPQGGAQ